MSKLNAKGEAKMRTHIKHVKAARASLEKDIQKLKTKTHKKITGALGEDHEVLSDMKEADRKKKR